MIFLPAAQSHKKPLIFLLGDFYLCIILKVFEQNDEI